MDQTRVFGEEGGYFPPNVFSFFIFVEIFTSDSKFRKKPSFV